MRHKRTFQDKNATNPNRSPKSSRPPSTTRPSNQLQRTPSPRPSPSRSIDHRSNFPSMILTNHPSNNANSAYPFPSYTISERNKLPVQILYINCQSNSNAGFIFFSAVDPALKENFCLIKNETSFATETLESILVQFYYQIEYNWDLLKLSETSFSDMTLVVEENLTEMLMQSFYEECMNNESKNSNRTKGQDIISIFLEGISSSPSDLPIQGVHKN